MSFARREERVIERKYTISIIAIVLGAVVMLFIGYMALKMLSTVVVTPLTQTKELNDRPQEIISLPNESVLRLQVSPSGDFLACVSRSGVDYRTSLRVIKLGEGPEILVVREIKGENLAWLKGEGEYLLFEDMGDIYKMSINDHAVVNLTPDSAELDSDPLPSPDGKYIVWNRTPGQTKSEKTTLWWMRSDGSEKREIGASCINPDWNPDCRYLASYVQAGFSKTNRPNRYYLEIVDLATGRYDLFAESQGETRFVAWLDSNRVVYVAMYITADLSEVKGLVYATATENGAETETLGTLNSLEDPDRPYLIRISREEERLAYLGSNGLEIFDIEERMIYRVTRVKDLSTLDWFPGGNRLIFADDEKVFSLGLSIAETQ